ncbi:MAG: hypothetical protein HeimC3_31500 [Candidatus Heimdallarchaeota archaeon LC_3]|nr:MAG: hypothetical protein HeimC3_31500 [Candidatus Heimdallarchaeota archaeon LC_3]
MFEMLNITEMWIIEVIDKITELPKDKEIGVICYGAGESMAVTQMLIDRGFTNAENIEGGIIRYALDVDNSLLELFKKMASNKKYI